MGLEIPEEWLKERPDNFAERIVAEVNGNIDVDEPTKTSMINAIENARQESDIRLEENLEKIVQKPQLKNKKLNKKRRLKGGTQWAALPEQPKSLTTWDQMWDVVFARRPLRRLKVKIKPGRK